LPWSGKAVTLSRPVVVSGHTSPFLQLPLTNIITALLGATNPLASNPGTIRGDYSIDVGRNICHGSDSVENAKKEIALWFKEGEVVSWKSAMHDWVYEK
jgi:nucleoside diphosphate kinase